MSMLTLCRIARDGSSSTASTMHIVKMRTHTLKISSSNYQNEMACADQRDTLTIYNNHRRGEHDDKLEWHARTRGDTCTLLAS